MSERTLHPIEYLHILKRRKAWFIVPFGVCTLATIALATLLPATYRSKATIAVQAPTVSPELVSARATLDREERLRALSQQLRSPAVLQRVARDEQLIAGRSMEEVTQDLHDRINVEPQKPIARTDGQLELNAFHISYDDRTPERAQRIANRLAHVFVDEHSRSRELIAEGTAEFIAGQLRTTQARISALEAKIRAAKEQYIGKLPEQTMANLSTLSGMRQQLESTANLMRTEQERLTLIDRHMQSIRQGAYSVSTGVPGVVSSPAQRVAALQRELALARETYKPTHPEIELLEGQLKAARAEAAAIGKQSSDSRQELLAGDPAYQQLAGERNVTELRIKSAQRTYAQLQSDIAKYQQRVEAAPMVEQEMASLNREYEQERENFKSLSTRLTAAQEREQIAYTGGGERFSVLNSAYFPHSPESPNRLRILMVGLALAFALGGAAVFGREYLDWSIRDARVLEDQFEVPVLAEIPHIRDAA